jgi:hypothetical protein
MKKILISASILGVLFSQNCAFAQISNSELNKINNVVCEDGSMTLFNYIDTDTKTIGQIEIEEQQDFIRVSDDAFTLFRIMNNYHR